MVATKTEFCQNSSCRVLMCFFSPLFSFFHHIDILCFGFCLFLFSLHFWAVPSFLSHFTLACFCEIWVTFGNLMWMNIKQQCEPFLSTSLKVIRTHYTATFFQTYGHSKQILTALHMSRHSTRLWKWALCTIRVLTVRRHPTCWGPARRCRQTTSTGEPLPYAARSSWGSPAFPAPPAASSGRPCGWRWPGRRTSPCRSSEPWTTSAGQQCGGTAELQGAIVSTAIKNNLRQ